MNSSDRSPDHHPAVETQVFSCWMRWLQWWKTAGWELNMSKGPDQSYICSLRTEKAEATKSALLLLQIKVLIFVLKNESRWLPYCQGWSHVLPLWFSGKAEASLESLELFGVWDSWFLLICQQPWDEWLSQILQASIPSVIYTSSAFPSLDIIFMYVISATHKRAARKRKKTNKNNKRNPKQHSFSPSSVPQLI